MKNHLIIWIDQGKDVVDIPFWGDLIKNDNLKAQRFYPEIASLFRKHNVPVLYSKEYKPKLQQWSAEEVESGLNRVFRIILQQDRQFPKDLISDISLVPYVKKVKPGEIGVADIPPRISEAQALKKFDPSSLIYLEQAHAFSKGNPSGEWHTTVSSKHAFDVSTIID